MPRSVYIQSQSFHKPDNLVINHNLPIFNHHLCNDEIDSEREQRASEGEVSSVERARNASNNDSLDSKLKEPYAGLEHHDHSLKKQCEHSNDYTDATQNVAQHVDTAHPNNLYQSNQGEPFQIHPPPPYYAQHPQWPPPPYTIPAPHYPHYPYPPQGDPHFDHHHHPPPRKMISDPQQRKLRKNAISRHRAAMLRSKISTLKHIPDKTPQEEKLLHKHEQRRLIKNHRTKQRAAEKKALIEGILSKPENERNAEEVQILEDHFAKRARKNEGDRLRRIKMKEMGLKVKPPGIEIRGHDDNVYHASEYDPYNYQMTNEQYYAEEKMGMEEVSELLRDEEG